MIQDISGLAGVIQLLQQRAPGKAESAPQPASTPSSAAPSHEQVLQAVQEIRRAVEPATQNLRFTVDTETGKTVVRVIDDATQEVIRQIPNEEVLAIAKAIDRTQGLLLKQKI